LKHSERARLASIRSQLDAIKEGIADAHAKLDVIEAAEEAKKTKRSDAAKRGWATRRARRAAA
jgi:hypothetical protein